MSQQGKMHLCIVFSAPADAVSEGDRIFRSHAAFMEATHHRDGEKALLSYNISKGPELSNPLDPSSEPTGNTLFSIDEVYESDAGIQDHWGQAGASWGDLGALVEWSARCQVTTIHRSPIVHSLW